MRDSDRANIQTFHFVLGTLSLSESEMFISVPTSSLVKRVFFKVPSQHGLSLSVVQCCLDSFREII